MLCLLLVAVFVLRLPLLYQILYSAGAEFGSSPQSPTSPEATSILNSPSSGLRSYPMSHHILGQTFLASSTITTASLLYLWLRPGF